MLLVYPPQLNLRTQALVGLGQWVCGALARPGLQGQHLALEITESVAQLGHQLGLSVIAEGIEDGVAWQSLLCMGCQEGQGYHIALSMDRGALAHWIERHRASHPGA